MATDTSLEMSLPISSHQSSYSCQVDGVSERDRSIRAAAAAAARRKRRKALVRRSLKNGQKRIKISHPPFNNEVSKRPLASTTSQQQVVIQPTVVGVQEVVSILLQGQPVAVPTECTYELVSQFNWGEPNSWADRIKSVVGEDVLDLLSNPSSNESRSSNIRQTSTVSVSSTSSEGTTAGSDVCSEENLRRDLRLRPHVYLQPKSLDEPFWRSYFPKRCYISRSKEGEVVAAHAFNETQHILKLISSKVWPGPLSINVANVASPDRNFPDQLTTSRDGKRFVSFRSLCHPLTVKVHQEHKSRKNGEGVVLVGMAIRRRGSDQFVKQSNQVHSDFAVLNGEARQEVFAVPTCQYGEPCSTALWLDASERLVTVSSSSGSPIVSADQLLQLVRCRRVPKTDQDRVILSVLNQWNVVEDRACDVSESSRD